MAHEKLMKFIGYGPKGEIYQYKKLPEFGIYNHALYAFKDNNPDEEIKSTLEIRMNDITEVRDFLEPFYFYPSTNSDNVFISDYPEDPDDYVAGPDDAIDPYGCYDGETVYVAVPVANNKVAMVYCIDPEVLGDDEEDVSSIHVNLSTKKNITNGIVAYDSEDGKDVIFESYRYMTPMKGNTVVDVVRHRVNTMAISRLVEFSYESSEDFFNTAMSWISMDKKVQSKLSRVKNYHDVTKDSDGKMPVDLITLEVSNDSATYHSAYMCYKQNPNDEYITIKEVYFDGSDGSKFVPEVFKMITDELE